MAGPRRSGARDGGRSSGSSGCGATEHEEASGEALQPPGVTKNTVTHAVAGCSGLSDGGDMDGGEELRPWRKRRVRRRNDGEKRGKRGGAHGDHAEQHSGLRGDLVMANRRRQTAEPEEEDDGDGGAPGPPEVRVLTER